MLVGLTINLCCLAHAALLALRLLGQQGELSFNLPLPIIIIAKNIALFIY